ncbi:response regulator [Parathermosynechococcus lividus]
MIRRQQRPLIACIDDSRTVQRQISLILERSGYQVLTLTDPVAAVPRLIAEPPHLILLDINLPGVDGYEICRQLRRSPSLEHVPIVMLTAKDDPVHRIRARGVGAVDYITKPVTPQELVKRIQKLLNAGISPVATVSAQATPVSLNESMLLWSIAHLRLALSTEQQQALGKAIQKLQNAIAAAPEAPKPYAKLVLALYLTNQLAAARETLIKLIALVPTELNYYRNLAWIEEQLGDVNSAIAHYEYVLRLEPTDQRCQGRLDFLRQQR